MAAPGGLADTCGRLHEDETASSSHQFTEWQLQSADLVIRRSHVGERQGRPS